MNTIRTVAVLGAGAMGGLYASRFAEGNGFRVVFPSSGERAARLRRDGLVVNGVPLRCEVLEPNRPGQQALSADLVVVSVKHHQLEAALEDVAPWVGEGTVFLSVLNGLDSEEIIGHRFGGDKVLLCIALAMDATREGNEVHFHQAGRLHFGMARNDPVSPQVVRVQEALDRAGIEWETPVDMQYSMWWKFMVNVGVNQVSALMRATYGDCAVSGEARWLMDALMNEVRRVAAASGVDLTEEDVAAWRRVLDRQPAGGKTSMLQDVEAGRPTEVDIFAGKVVSLGKAHQVQTPYNETVWHIIRGLSNGAG